MQMKRELCCLFRKKTSKILNTDSQKIVEPSLFYVENMQNRHVYYTFSVAGQAFQSAKISIPH